MDRKTVHVLRNIRALNEANKLVWGRQDAGQLMEMTRVMNALALFPKIKGFDVGRLDKSFERDVRKRMGTLKFRLKKAKEYGDEEQINYFEELISEAGSRGRIE